MNLEPGWEKKALIIIAVITSILIIYAYGSSTSSPSITNQTEEPAFTPEPQISSTPSSNQSVSPNSTDYNLTTNNTNSSQNQLNTTSNALQQTSKAQSSLKTV